MHIRKILKHDNTRLHIARILSAFSNDHNIEVLEWTTNRPDLNPIEMRQLID